MEAKYNHKEVEKNKYNEWKSKKLFAADPNSNKPKFSIILPPPNVTGQLHLGHAWDGAIQDVLIRYKKLKGFDALFVPGTDHAGIATQVKVMNRIKEEKNINLKDIDKETFLEYAWKWKKDYHDTIANQWAMLGLALDYNYEKFTLDQNVNEAVNKVFVELYNKGLIYQGKKIVNWDTQLRTAISNVEVIYQEVKGKLYYFKYYLKDKSDYISVATTRPETMFGDQAIFVNSKDLRYSNFLNKEVINPANNELIRVISDDYVDIEFGSGAMKCTPAHDFNDFDLGKKYNLAMPICLTEEGKMNALANKYNGLDRFECRKKLVKDLTDLNLVDKVLDYVHQVGFSERTNVVVEPYLSKQWFIKMEDVANLIIKQQSNKDKKIEFFPKMFENQLLRWLNNIQDWCISRQLWWGHQLPVWYHKETKEVYVSASAPKNSEEYYRDNDVLDTWFSSALWPLVTLKWPNSQVEFEKYYPTSVLVTAYDILFFWVVRMMFMGLQLTSQNPFKHVLIHGLIRDNQGRKMSKSLNNGINPIDVINEHGTDALRYFLISNSAPGQDLRFSIEKIEASWNLINKLWNAARYVILNLDENFVFNKNFENLEFSFVDQWILLEFNELLDKVEKSMEKYEFVIVSHDLSNFIWNKFCSWYIELSKYNLSNEKLKNTSMQTLVYVLKQILIMLHPFIPFVTEEIFSKMGFKNSILKEKYPAKVDFKINNQSNYFVDNLIGIVSKIREIRKELNLGFKTKIEVHINSEDNFFMKNIEEINNYLVSIVNANIISISNNSLESNQKIIKILNNAILEVQVENLIDKKAEMVKLQQAKEKVLSEIKRSENILNNKNFLLKASEQKIEIEKNKYQDYQKQLVFIEEKIEQLK